MTTNRTVIMKNIYLVGFMGTGKTTTGKILAKKLNRDFVEMDDIIEERQKRKIVDIFAQKGEVYFRMRERELLEELSAREDLVVSCGGGICNKDNLKLLKTTGIVFNLTAHPQTIYERTKRYTSRPLLNVDNPLREIQNLFNKRQPYYNQAHYSVDSEKQSPEKIAEDIIKILIKDELLA